MYDLIYHFTSRPVEIKHAWVTFWILNLEVSHRLFSRTDLYADARVAAYFRHHHPISESRYRYPDLSTLHPMLLLDILLNRNLRLSEPLPQSLSQPVWLSVPIWTSPYDCFFFCLYLCEPPSEPLSQPISTHPNLHEPPYEPTLTSLNLYLNLSQPISTSIITYLNPFRPMAISKPLEIVGRSTHALLK